MIVAMGIVCGIAGIVAGVAIGWGAGYRRGRFDERYSAFTDELKGRVNPRIPLVKP